MTFRHSSVSYLDGRRLYDFWSLFSGFWRYFEVQTVILVLFVKDAYFTLLLLCVPSI